jgi:methyl-accepting chemotaxis protein
MNESTEKMLKTFDASIGSVVETNKEVNEIMGILKNRQEEIERLIIHINEIGSAIEQLQKLESVLNRIASK